MHREQALRGISVLSDAGFSFVTIRLDDITVSDYDGRVKVGSYREVISCFAAKQRSDFDQALYQGPEVQSVATPFKDFLENVLKYMSATEGLSHLHAFIQDAGCSTYQELQKVGSPFHPPLHASIFVTLCRRSF